MRIVRATIITILGFAFLFPGAARAGFTSEVVVSDNDFTPETANLLAASQAGALRWRGPDAGTTNDHNVRGMHRFFVSGEPRSWDASTTFDVDFSAGRFDYECEVHGSAMSGVVSVRVGQDITEDEFPLIKWALPESTTGRVYDVQFKVNDGDWRNWKVDTERLRGVFGRNGRPVEFDDVANDYRFRARSQKRVDTPRKVSRWSPTALFD